MARMMGNLPLVGAPLVAVAALGLCLAAHAAPKYKVLHSFTGSDGAGPYGGVIGDQKGNLYGTTAGGGTGRCRGGCGTVFQLTPQPNGAWLESVLHSFEEDGPDGANPYGGLVLDAVGNLYGTTITGGLYYSGTVFELTHGPKVWMESILYNFCPHSGCKDGGSPWAGLTWDRAGNLYGTAGVVFELSPVSSGWSEKVIHRFTKHLDGGAPFAGLILDAAGNLYGTTEAGGTYGIGTAYEVRRTSEGWNERLLHSFNNNGSDGHTPGNGALVMDHQGNLYGTTEVGGTVGYGTVFKLAPGSGGRWKETILYDFKPGTSGWFPAAGVVMDKAGNLYGTTTSGGTGCDCGVVYKLAPQAKGKWKYTVLHRFTNVDGAVPAGNLIFDDEGNLYGSTILGGTSGDGVVFELTP